ncbi:MAG: DUF3488 and DUF4129 domain-containing transglutaminase family protein [Oscillospiraceae bacterium]
MEAMPSEKQSRRRRQRADAPTLFERLADFLFYAIMAPLYTFALGDSILTSTVLELPELTLFLYCTALALAFYLLFYNRWTILAFTGLVAVLLLGSFLYLRSQNFEVGWYIELQALAEELYQFFHRLIPYRPLYGQVFGLLIAALLGMFTAICLRASFNLLLPTLLGVVVIAIPRYFEWGESRLSILLFAFCFIVFAGKRLNLSALRKETGMHRRNPVFSLAMIPLAALVMGVSLLLPSPDLDRDRDISPPDLVGAADNLLYDLGPSQMFAFSDQSELGGPVNPGDGYVMTVLADDPVYLAGQVMDRYDGHSWKNTQTKLSPLTPGEDTWYRTDPNKALFDLQAFYTRYYAVPTRTAEARMGANRTRNIFSPPGSSLLWISDEVQVNQNPAGVLSTGRPLEPNTVYTQDYIAWNYNSTTFQNVLRMRSADVEQGGLDGFPSPIPLSAEDQKRYTQLPNNLPQRVGDLAQEIAGGMGNDYDRLQALERHLSTTFPYTYTPSEVPGDADFVDYFLFEGKEGYCVYYASAMVVMARTMGIPTRYVEGFAMPERNAEGTFTVTNRQAHAWVEAYLEGFGWLRFEPTAAYTDSFYDGTSSTPEAELPEPEPEPEVTPPDPETPEPLPEENSDPGSTPTDPANPGGEQSGGEQEQWQMPAALKAVLIILLLLGLLALYVWLMVKRDRARIAHIGAMPNGEACEAWFALILRGLTVLGYPIQPDETAYAYAERVRAQLPELDLAELAERYARAAYSGKETEEGDRAAMEADYNRVQAMLRRKLSPPGYLVARYILLQI